MIMNPDDVKRMLMIIKETELASLSGEELEDWLRKAQSYVSLILIYCGANKIFNHRLNY